MKAYVVREGDLYETDVPDGTLLLDVGSVLDPAGGPDLPPISMIDYNLKVFRRDGSDLEHPFPELTSKYDDLKWSECEGDPMRQFQDLVDARVEQ